LRLRAAAVATVALVAGLSGCGLKGSASGDFHPRHEGVLTVATSEVPLPGFWEGTAAKPTGGFEYELARALADRFGLKSVKIVVMPFDRLVRGDLGGADLALADVTDTAEREKVLEFTGAYLAASPAVLVRTGKSVPDLKTARGLTWAVGRATTLQQFLDGTIRPTKPPLITSSRLETSAAVTEKSAEAGLLDLPVAAAIARESNGKLHVAGQFESNDDISAALPKGSSNVDAVASALRRFVADGTISSLARRWLGLRLNGTSADHVPLIRTEQ
jgi:ABC-type amino acid transport substrate-binding protein